MDDYESPIVRSPGDASTESLIAGVVLAVVLVAVTYIVAATVLSVTLAVGSTIVAVESS